MRPRSPADWLDELETPGASTARFVQSAKPGSTSIATIRRNPRNAPYSTRSSTLAARLQLPVFVHDRDTDGAVADALTRHRAALRDVVVHCFTGAAAELRRYLELDCHIGITGWICDERRGLGTEEPRRAQIPDDRLLIETDAPYLLPRTMTPRPKTRRNEPAISDLGRANGGAGARSDGRTRLRRSRRQCATRVRTRLTSITTRSSQNVVGVERPGQFRARRRRDDRNRRAVARKQRCRRRRCRPRRQSRDAVLAYYAAVARRFRRDDNLRWNTE